MGGEGGGGLEEIKKWQAGGCCLFGTQEYLFLYFFDDFIYSFKKRNIWYNNKKYFKL